MPSPMVDVTGALLGTAFSELFKAIKKHIETVRSFPSQFKKLKSTCEAIELLFNDMAKFNEILDRHPQELKPFRELLKDGKTLIDKCSRVHRFNFYAKYDCGKRLTKLDDEIKRSILVFLTPITARDVNEIAVDVKGVSVDVKVIRSAVEKLIVRLEIDSDGVTTSGVGGGYNGKYVEPKPPGSVIGMDERYKEVRSRLMQDGVSVIVISGPGGVGKTTLAKKLLHDEEVKGKFKENAFFFPVSQSFNPVLTIQKMCRHKNLDVSNIRNEDDAFCALEELVSQIGEDPILLVLDDVWSESKTSTTEPSKTESLLERFVIHNKKNYKILVSSRFEFPSFGPSIRLEPLNHKDAKDLLLNAARPMEGPFNKPDDRIIDQILMQCKGLPLALEVVGKSLRGRPQISWENRLLKWNDGVSILDSDNEILICLQQSLVDFSSGSETKECFMDLGSFPEDHMIPACALIEMWAELHNLDGEGVHAMHILHELSNRSLIDLVVTRTNGDGKNKGYENDSVMQHDLLRQLAIHQSSREPIEQRKRVMMHIRGNTFPEWWTKLKKQPLNAKLLSISTDEMFSSGWPDLDAPAAEVVVLNFRANSYTLPEFTGRMTKLKALIVANNSLFPAKLTNFSLLGSLSSLKRIRLERIRIPFLHMENIQLNNLQKISLFMCDISKEGLLSDEAMPNLLEISVAYCKNLVRLPAGFCNVKSLRKLSITNCPDLCELPQSIGNLFNLETLRLNSCTKLQDLPDAIGNLQNMTLLDISDCIEMKELPYQVGELSKLEELHMEGRLNLFELPPTVKKLQSLKRVTCHESKATLWKPFMLYLTELKVKIIEEEISLGWLRSSRG